MEKVNQFVIISEHMEENNVHQKKEKVKDINENIYLYTKDEIHSFGFVVTFIPSNTQSLSIILYSQD